MFAALKALGIVTVLGLSFYLTGYLFRWKSPHRHSPTLNILFGFLFFELINMANINLNWSNAILLTCTFAGLFFFFKNSTFSLKQCLTIPVLIVFLFLSSIIFMNLQEPIIEWDPRSIWFFHAKVIYHTKSFWAFGDWIKEAYAFSMPGYPKLMPLLAAQIASIFGYWNEYFPKLAQALLSLPILGLILEKNSKHYLGFGLMLLLFFYPDCSAYYMTSGYVDGWVAFYGVCVATFASELLMKIKNSEPCHYEIEGFLLFSGTTTQLKQEGIAVVFVISSVCFILSVINQKRSLILSEFKKNILKLNTLSIAVFSLLPFLIWKIGSQIQKLAVHQYASGMTERIPIRLQETGTPTWILINLFFHNPMVISSFIVLCLVLLISFIIHIPITLKTKIYAFSGFGYLGTLGVAYLGTADPVLWHLATSAGRVTIVPAWLILAAITSEIENFYQTKLAKNNHLMNP